VTVWRLIGGAAAERSGRGSSDIHIDIEFRYLETTSYLMIIFSRHDLFKFNCELVMEIGVRSCELVPGPWPLGVSPSPRVRRQSACFTYLLITYYIDTLILTTSYM